LPEKWFVTDDTSSGELRRVTPTVPGPAGLVDPDAIYEYAGIAGQCNGDSGSGSFFWTTSLSTGQSTANECFPNAEGIDVRDGKVYFVSKALKRLVILDLDALTYEYSSTQSGAFNNQPDQVARILNSDDDVLYFCEDGGNDCGVHGRAPDGRFFTILEGPGYNTETTGLAFSPDRKRMFVSFQGSRVFEITREDGFSFAGGVLDIKYHA